MNLYENIKKRKSSRKYKDKVLQDDVIQKIKKYMIEMPIIKEDKSLRVHFIKDGVELYNILPIIGKIKAPHYVVFTGKKTKESLINTGYAIEHLVLYLTSLGIGTCFIGSKITNEKLSKIIDIDSENEWLITLAFGNTQDPKDIFRKEDDFKRLNMKDLILSGYLSLDLKYIIEAARLAPSALNSQPWRFKLEDNVIHIYKKDFDFIRRKLLKDMSYIDLGIVLCHLKLAICSLGYDFNITNSNVKLKDYVYISSIELIK